MICKNFGDLADLLSYKYVHVLVMYLNRQKSKIRKKDPKIIFRFLLCYLQLCSWSWTPREGWGNCHLWHLVWECDWCSIIKGDYFLPSHWRNSNQKRYLSHWRSLTIFYFVVYVNALIFNFVSCVCMFTVFMYETVHFWHQTQQSTFIT